MGGALVALKSGFQQRRIHDSAWKQMQDVESHLRKVVGVNHALMDEDLQYEGEEIDPGISEMQSAKMAQLHEIRNEEIVLEAIRGQLSLAPAHKGNLEELKEWALMYVPEEMMRNSRVREAAGL